MSCVINLYGMQMHMCISTSTSESANIHGFSKIAELVYKIGMIMIEHQSLRFVKVMELGFVCLPTPVLT